MASTSTKTKATKMSGFSLVEMMVTVIISLILTAVAVMTLQPMLRQEHVNDAYNTTLTALRRAHDQAAADMRIYLVTFTPAVGGANPNGGTITATQFNAVTPTTLFSVTLPADVTFNVTAGVPVSNVTAPTTPDSFGTASAGAFDFDQPPSGTGGGSTIYFYPDGSAQDANGNVNNGVVYISMPGVLNTCRAVTLWGYTGRIRGWRLTQVSGVWTWSQT